MTTIISLSLVLIWELSIGPEKLDEFLATTEAEIVASRSFSGNIRFEIMTDLTNPTQVVFVEEWESEASQQAYWQWRVETGGVATLQKYLVAEPVLKRYQKIR